MKKYWVRGLGVVGALLTIQTVVWEYARMRPDYGFIVDPWSMRGYEIGAWRHHRSIGVLALVVVPPRCLEGVRAIRRSEQGSLLFIAVGATAIAAVFGGGDYDVHSRILPDRSRHAHHRHAWCTASSAHVARRDHGDDATLGSDHASLG